MELALQNAFDNLEQKKLAVDDAQRNLNEKENTAKVLHEEYDTATHKRLEGEVDLEVAKDELDYANYVKNIASRDAKEAEERYNKAKDVYDKEKGQQNGEQNVSINDTINNSRSGGGITEINNGRI